MITKISVKEAKNLKDKIWGLIGKAKPASLMIKTRFGIHTFGLRLPIDVVILDNRSKIVSIKKNLVPGRIFLWNPRYDNVLELPEKTISKKRLKIGDTINLDLKTA